jgi:hypothetical protein
VHDGTAVDHVVAVLCAPSQREELFKGNKDENELELPSGKVVDKNDGIKEGATSVSGVVVGLGHAPDKVWIRMHHGSLLHCR